MKNKFLFLPLSNDLTHELDFIHSIESNHDSIKKIPFKGFN